MKIANRRNKLLIALLIILVLAFTWMIWPLRPNVPGASRTIGWRDSPLAHYFVRDLAIGTNSSNYVLMHGNGLIDLNPGWSTEWQWSPGSDLYISHLDNNLVFTDIIATQGNIDGTYLIKSFGSNIYCVGINGPTIANGYFVLSLNDGLRYNWSVNLPEGIGLVDEFEIDDDGNLYVMAPSSSEYSTMVVKISESGEVMWAKGVTEEGRYDNHGLAVDSRGIVYLGIMTSFERHAPDSHPFERPINSIQGLLICALDPEGNEIERKYVERSVDTIVTDRIALAVDEDDSIYLASSFRDDITFYSEDGVPEFSLDNDRVISGFLAKWNSDFDFEWAGQWRGNGYVQPIKILSNGSGSMYVCGTYTKNFEFIGNEVVIGLATETQDQNLYILGIGIDGSLTGFWSGSGEGRWGYLRGSHHMPYEYKYDLYWDAEINGMGDIVYYVNAWYGAYIAEIPEESIRLQVPADDEVL